MLAAAQEPSTLERILDWAGIVAPDDEKQKLRRILTDKWRPFLVISGEGKEEKYRFYHATVREFFEGKAEHNSPMATENDLADELSLATRERHRVIAESYLARWGGLEKGLPDLVNKRDEDNGYGLRHLAAHLEVSGQDDELHHLFKLETSQGRNLWYEAKEAIGDTTGYINDVMRARRLAEERYDPEDIKKTGKSIGLQNRYALIFASINSLSGNIPSELLLALVENGIWSKEEGLAHARHVPDRSKRSRVLAELSSLLNEPKFMDEALFEAREIQNLEDYCGTLAEIVPKIQDIDNGLAMAREIMDDYCRAIALAEISLRLPEDQKIKILDEALLNARESKDCFGRAEDSYWRAIALAEIAPRLPDAQKTEILMEAFLAALEIKADRSRAIVMAEIVPKLHDINDALSIAREIQDGYGRAKVLGKIAPRLPDAQKTEVLMEALSATREIQDDQSQAIAQGMIGSKLKNADEALAIA